MRNRFLLLIATTLLFSFSQAQVNNAGFEVWERDSTIFPGYSPYLAGEKFYFQDPVGWTSSNAISALTAFGGFSFVTESASSYEGGSALQIKTDTIKPVGGYKLTVPGYAMNGAFTLNIATLITGAVITPIQVKGAGQPCTQRLEKIKGVYNYDPVFNPNTQQYDTCIVWATLRKGPVAIADAIFKSIDSTGEYRQFEASFTYHSCEEPDTLVILVASSIPNITGLFGGQSNLVRGSVLLVDELGYDTLAADYNFTPFARADVDTTDKNTQKNVLVKLNDEDCDDNNPDLAIILVSQPAHGSAVVNEGNVSIGYLPANDYVGLDTFSYTLNDGPNTSKSAKVTVFVRDNTGINDANLLPVTLYPVPTVNELHIQFDNKGRSTARVYDMVGALVGTYSLNGNSNTIGLSQFANGMYSMQIVNTNNEIIARSKFAVSK